MSAPLEEALGRLCSIVDLVPSPAIVYDGDGRILLVNKEWNRLTGFTISDIPTVSDWEIKAFGAPELSKLGDGERQFLTREENLLIWEFRSLSVGTDSDGRELFILMGVDLTARRMAEHAKRENAAKFDTLAEESPLGIVIARNETIIYCNGTAGRLFGVPPRLAQGLILDEWLLALPAEASPVMGLLLRGEESRAGPFRIGPGRGTWIEAFGKDVGAAAGDMIMATFLDVTERVYAEERERVQRERLIQAEKLASLGELVAGVAHEINNPNHTISLNADILSQSFGDMLKILDRALDGREGDLVGGMEWTEAREQLPQLLKGIVSASRDIEFIVKGLKDYARREDRPEIEDVDLNLVVEASLTLLSNFIKKSTHHLKVDLKPGLPPVKAHFQRLEQVVVNLVQNSCQALTAPDQAVYIRTSYDPETELVCLSVEDEGRGMSPEVLDRIKDPFFTTKHDMGGVGLGVSISESIVTEYGGRLEYSSEPGSGTKANVSLRASAQKREAAQ